MAKFEVRLEGMSSLLLRSTRGLNPMDPLVKEMKRVSSNRKKTEDDHLKLLELDFMLSFYAPYKGLEVFLPAQNVLATIRDGCKRWKLGKNSENAVTILQSRIPIQHDGPDTAVELYQVPQHVDVCDAKIGTSKVLRCRPIFDDWAMEFEVELCEEYLSVDDFIRGLEEAGKTKGLGDDRRHQHGRFKAIIKQIA